MNVHTMHITPNGFDLTFTRPVDETLATHADTYQFQWYYYEYHEAYVLIVWMDITKVNVKIVDISDDGKKVSLIYPKCCPAMYMISVFIICRVRRE